MTGHNKPYTSMWTVNYLCMCISSLREGTLSTHIISIVQYRMWICGIWLVKCTVIVVVCCGMFGSILGYACISEWYSYAGETNGPMLSRQKPLWNHNILFANSDQAGAISDCPCIFVEKENRTTEMIESPPFLVAFLESWVKPAEEKTKTLQP